MSHNYMDWADLNDEGKKELGDIFPDGVFPIVSMIPILFEGPGLESPERGYLVRASELTKDQIDKFVDRIAEKRGGEDRKEEIRKDLLENNVPIREKFTCGVGTKRIYMYMDDDLFDEEEDYEDEEGEDVFCQDDDWSIEDEWQAQEIAKSRNTSEKRLEK